MKKLIAISGLMLISFAASAVKIEIDERLVNNSNETIETNNLNKKKELDYSGHVNECGGGQFQGKFSYTMHMKDLYSHRIDNGEEFRRDLSFTISGKDDEKIELCRIFMGDDVQILRSSKVLRIKSKNAQVIVLKD